MPIFNKNKSKAPPISLKRVSTIPQSNLNISASHYRETDFLRSLSTESNIMKAIELILDKTPDGKMASNIYLRLANQGYKVKWYNNSTGKLTKKYDKDCAEFSSRMGKNNSAGLDGLLDQLHWSAIARGGMACEVVVGEDAKEIEEVALIDPITFEKFEWLENKNRYAIYQRQQNGNKVDLYDGNFFYIPHQPKVGRPDGSLQFEASIMIMEQFYSFMKDSTAVLERIGFPRYKFSINSEKFFKSIEGMTNEEKKKASEEYFAEVEGYAKGLKNGSDFLSFDDTQVDVIGAGVNGTGIDIRAWFEVIEPLVINSFQLTPVLMGRLKAGSYSLGSVEFKIVVDTVDSMRRNSKRMMENIYSVWARVIGINATPSVELNPILWEKVIEKLNAEMLEIEKNRKGEEYGYISHDMAAMNTFGVEKADNYDSKGFYQYLKSGKEKDKSTNNKIESDGDGE